MEAQVLSLLALQQNTHAKSNQLPEDIVIIPPERRVVFPNLIYQGKHWYRYRSIRCCCNSNFWHRRKKLEASTVVVLNEIKKATYSGSRRSNFSH
jgi:hypothetical protein